MSISIMIDEPKNEDEKQFFIPVATEKIFNDYWLVAAQELGLQWVPVFATGIFVEQGDLIEVIDEIEKIKCWMIKNVPDIKIQKELLDRIVYVIQGLLPLQEQKEIRLYIG